MGRDSGQLPKLTNADRATNYIEVCIEQMCEQYPGQRRGHTVLRGLLRAAARLAPEGFTLEKFLGFAAKAWKEECGGKCVSDEEVAVVKIGNTHGHRNKVSTQAELVNRVREKNGKGFGE